VKQLYIAGAWLMGAGIAQTAITCGFDVLLRDVDEVVVSRGLDNITKRLERQVNNGKLDAGKR